MNDNLLTCSLEEFFDHHLPNPGIELDVVVEDLKKQKALVSRDRSLHQKATSSSHRPAFSHTFKAFKSLFRSRTASATNVVKALQTVSNTVRKALGRATDSRASEVSGSGIAVEAKVEHVVYGCITPNLHSEGPLHPTDVEVPITVLPQGDDLISSKDPATFLSRLAQVMNEDARRRFCYGTTFQGSEVTLWRFTRSVSVKSTPFDMIDHPDLLTRLFIAFFLSPRDHLGYDPLVTLLPDLSYVYEIPSSGPAAHLYYKTIASPIWDAQPKHISGRTSRVWEVEQVESASSPICIPGTSSRVLKDVFLDSEAPTEAEIQDALFTDITVAKSEH
ncbi:other/FunK1 protein kinase [Coprinopsis cinerea AmutBmut pab1-1]|nr:other/FunK1 protein kinase [Coprinopsis cinerea AmutBmut pab1-1]